MGPKKTEATKKPSGGKKKLSGFMLFSQKNREIVKSENPGNLPRRALSVIEYRSNLPD